MITISGCTGPLPNRDGAIDELKQVVSSGSRDQKALKMCDQIVGTNPKQVIELVAAENTTFATIQHLASESGAHIPQEFSTTSPDHYSAICVYRGSNLTSDPEKQYLALFYLDSQDSSILASW